MNKQIMSNLRHKCKQMLAYEGTADKQKFLLIDKILANDNCFLQMDVQTSTNILLDLGFSMNEAVKIYTQLVSRNNFGE